MERIGAGGYGAGIGGGNRGRGDCIRRVFVSICSFFMKTTQYDVVNDSIRSHTIVYDRFSSYTTRRYTVVNRGSGNTTKYDRILHCKRYRLRSRIRSFTAVVMLVLGSFAIY
jgi:hypothetical protein